jgi:phage I-like protein
MMNGLALATCDRALAPGTAPEWVHLLPQGQMTGRDGRKFDLADPGAIVLAFQAAGVDLPIDYEHQNDRPEAKNNGPVPAAGWIKALRSDDTGLWGRVEWTATAREMIANREYRYLSPSFLYHPKTTAIVRLKGAGLVHNPNLHLTALASQDSTMSPAPNTMPNPMQQITEALGLGPDATPEAVLAAITDMKSALAKIMGKDDVTGATMAELASGAVVPDPAKYVPVATVQAMLTERNANLATMSEARAADKVADAMRKGYLSPAMKDWAMGLCRSDEASFDSFIATSIPQFAHLMQPSRFTGTPPAARGPSTAESEAAAAICAQLGLKPDALNS